VSEIRSYRPTDRDDVFEVCVRTGDSGADATGLYSTDALLPDIYALPYVDLEPDWAFVVDNGERAVGYVLAAPDTRAFVERYRADWLPGFAAKYAQADPDSSSEARFIDTGLHPERMLIPELEDYPAHLHIDLMPELQGQGFGRALIRYLVERLREAGVPGVHLGVSATNTNARAFYARLGFVPLSSVADGTRLGLRTDVEL
jgi:Acetyltransferases